MLFLLTVVLLSHIALAKATDNAPARPSPKAGVAEDDEVLGAPQVTIIKRNGETIEEYRISGQLYMMKITPQHGVPYYMYKEDADGGWALAGPVPPMSIPKWVIFRF